MGTQPATHRDLAKVLRAFADQIDNDADVNVDIYQELSSDGPGKPRRVTTRITLTGKPDAALYGVDVHFGL